MKRIFSFVLCMVCFLAFSSYSVSADENVILSGSVSARVVEIIDGDSIKVQLLENGDTALVKLIGVDAQGYNEAVSFLTSYLLGQNVVVSTDYNITSPTGMWNNMYITLNGESVNNMLIEKGYGVANASHMSAGQYSSYLTAQRNAKSRIMGIWDYGVRENTAANNYGLITYTGGRTYKSGIRVNINTATADTLAKELNNVTSSVANAMVRYREKNPFSTVSEVKFVEGFTKELYDENKSIMVVCTNVNDADEKELYSLGYINEDEVDEIISYRKKYDEISYVSQLKEEKLVSDNRYKKIKDFISVRDKDEIDITENEYVVNINTASYSNLMSTGMSSSDAKKIIEYRTNGYTFKTLMEIAKLPGVGLSENEINALEDNLTVRTDMNEASDSEMKSVFGNEAQKVIYRRRYISPSDVTEYISYDNYEKIKDVIYTGTKDPEYVNINTATASQLKDIGFSADMASRFAGKSNMKSAKDLPADISLNNANASLFTNINTASVKELESLNNGITTGLINEIISYREEQPFGTRDEMQKFFSDRNAFGFYNSVREYLVVR